MTALLLLLGLAGVALFWYLDRRSGRRYAEAEEASSSLWTDEDLLPPTAGPLAGMGAGIEDEDLLPPATEPPAQPATETPVPSATEPPAQPATETPVPSATEPPAQPPVEDVLPSAAEGGPDVPATDGAASPQGPEGREDLPGDEARGAF